MITRIDRNELKDLINHGEPVALVETLPKTEFDATHLPGAVNLSPTRVKANARKVLPDQSAEVVVYCGSESCDASEKAARVLEGLGYTNIRVYKGGKQDWIDSGLPVEGAEVVPTI